jgi:hypothetical protein
MGDEPILMWTLSNCNIALQSIHHFKCTLHWGIILHEGESNKRDANIGTRWSHWDKNE